MYRNIEPIILASGSPRRKDYLEQMGLTFTVRTASVAEQPFNGEDPENFVLRMARDKAAEVSGRFPDAWVISGDTVVCLGRRILGKPTDKEEAVNLLLELSGREHSVKTGFCLVHGSRKVMIARSVTTKVRFAQLSRSIVQSYVATGESLDKAGAYGIQGRGGCLVRSIEGSYSNVVGLPLYELLEVLLENGVVEPSVLC